MSRRLSAAQVADLAAKPNNGMVFINRGHTRGCDLIVTGRCTCRPTFSIGPLTPEAVKSAADSMALWRKERLS
jgi:hypothetical protein